MICLIARCGSIMSMIIIPYSTTQRKVTARITWWTFQRKKNRKLCLSIGKMVGHNNSFIIEKTKIIFCLTFYVLHHINWCADIQIKTESKFHFFSKSQLHLYNVTLNTLYTKFKCKISNERLSLDQEISFTVKGKAVKVSAQ
jgi:hypothetical protein